MYQMINLVKPSIGEEEKKAVLEVLNSGMLAQGPRVKDLERLFAEFCGTKYAIAVSSGTTALHTALYSLGIKPGDEVITVPFTFVATANCIIMQNARPIFVDIKEDTFNIDTEGLKEKITPKTKAIIPIDLYGQIYDYKALKEIAEDHNLLILEDAAQAVCAELDKKKAGDFGDMAAFSLYATKNLISGEGGLITTDNGRYAELAKRFRHHGQDKKTRYEYYGLGYNYRMTDIQAAIALEQLKKIEMLTDKRIKNARYLTKELNGIIGIETPFIKKNSKHVFHQYTIKVTDESKLTRDELKNKLIENGIGCAVFYPKPLHLHPFFLKFGYKKGDFPISEKVSQQVLSLPVHPLLKKSELDEIIRLIGEILG